MTTLKTEPRSNPNFGDNESLVVYLIGEELKSRKFFRVLGEAGLEDCPYQPHLDPVIMRLLGLDDNDDEVVDWYDEIMEKMAQKIEPDRKAVEAAASEVLSLLKKRSTKS